MRGVDKVTVFAVLAGVAAVSASCILDIDGVLARAAPRDGGVDASGAGSGSSGAGTNGSTASSGGGGAMPATTTSSTGTGGGGQVSLSCSPSECATEPCLVDNGADGEASKQISALVASDKYLFWTSQSANKLWRRSFDQPSATLFSDGTPSPSAIALNGTHVYWADKEGIWRCAIEESDCPKNKVNTFTPVPPGGTGVTATVRSLIATANELYWAYDVSDPASGRVERCSIIDELSCKNTPTVVVGPNQTHPQQLVLEPGTGDLIWTNNGTNPSDGILIHWNKMTNTRNNLLAGRAFPAGLALSVVSGKTTVFWSELGPPSAPTHDGVFACQPDMNHVCSSPSPIGAQSTSMPPKVPLDITVDSESLYWTSPGFGAVLKCKAPCLDGKINTLASKQRNPHAIAVHAPSNCVFWADETDGGRMLRRYRL